MTVVFFTTNDEAPRDAATRDDTPKRPRGRPVAEEPKTNISAWIPVRTYDQLTRLALERDASLSRLVGEAVQTMIRNGRPKR